MKMSQTSKPNVRDALRATAPKLIELTEDVIYGDVWEREEMSKRDRSLITIASLISMGRERQLVGHLGRALDNGVTQAEIIETITHLAFYSGWPTCMTAAAIAKDVFAEREADAAGS
jgi:4-carboxymuconolactone decarboxylase